MCLMGKWWRNVPCTSPSLGQHGALWFSGVVLSLDYNPTNSFNCHIGKLKTYVKKNDRLFFDPFIVCDFDYQGTYMYLPLLWLKIAIILYLWLKKNRHKWHSLSGTCRLIYIWYCCIDKTFKKFQTIW